MQILAMSARIAYLKILVRIVQGWVSDMGFLLLPIPGENT